MPLILLVQVIHGQYLSTETLAIPYFKNNAENSEYAWLSEALADMLTTDIAATKKIWVVNRLDLKEVLEEQKLSLSGMVSDASMINLGNLSGASLILTGSFTIYDDQIRIDAKVFNTETGTSQGAASTMGSVQDIFILEKKLAVQVLEALSLPISEDDKINLFQIASGNLKAVENNYRGVIALDKDDKEIAKQYFQKAVADDPYYRSAQSNLDVTTKAIDGGGLFASALGELDEKERQLARLGEIINNFKEVALEVSVIGKPEIITSTKDSEKVDIALQLEMSVSKEQRIKLLKELEKISMGTQGWNIHDFAGYGNKLKKISLFDESQQWLANRNCRFDFVKLIQLHSQSEILSKTKITMRLSSFSSEELRILLGDHSHPLPRCGKSYKTGLIYTPEEMPYSYKYTIKNVPLKDVKKMTHVTIVDITGE